MKVPLEWLKEYVAVKLTARQLAERLTMAGLEVTGVALVNREEVLDLEVTPNRADCLSIIGLAREVAAIVGEPLKVSKLTSSQTAHAAVSAQHAPVRITIDDRKGCLRYIGRLIDDVRVGPSPDWMQKRLTACGLRPINNIVDVTNYVLLEYGQPLHAFDVDRLAERSIIVRRARPKEPMTTLDGVARTLTPEMLVIADAKQAVAVAGVMGGTGTEVTSQTRSILLESALFDPVTVRRTARELGVATESSYRFERGVDPVGVDTASARAAALMTKVAGGTERAVRDVGTKPAQRTLITLDAGRLVRWLGTPVPPATIRATLVKLGCRVASGAGDAMQVSAPSFRRDLAHSVDLFEEVARIVGYDRIPAHLPVAPMALPSTDTSSYISLQLLRRLCAGLGLTEVITWALVSEADLSRWGATAARLANPLSHDHAYLRPSLLIGLLQTVRRNLTQGLSVVRLFELGGVFRREAALTETQRLGVVLSGAWLRDWRTTQPCDFFQLKGLLETIVQRQCGVTLTAEPANEPWAEPGESARLLMEGRPLGTAGRVARHIAQALDLEQDVWFAELEVEALLGGKRRAASILAPPQFPPVKRDLSIIVDDGVSFERLHEAIRESGGALAASVELIDRYAGKQVPAGKHSLTFSIDYRDSSRTLTAAEVDVIHRRIGETLIGRFGASLR